ncbi:unnamed protein product [Adineta steineri]|uniref:Beta-lactamase-related domain-containing protein n=1 Tax=Adineta steineri TaxID=433720 RepID=A0A813YKB7_9BILA|nr:unnamed protein product [Adineta steineri]CAF4094795.1 unnamed protein product [Adineta steineri]
MQLVEKELIDLDTDINQHLSEPNRKIFHPRYPSHSITLRKLLSHSASIAVNSKLRDTFYQPDDTAFAQSTLADMCFTHINPNTSNWLPEPPGSVTFYSNEGSALAALVVERVTKTPYNQYIKDNILKPLNIDINKTGVRLADFPNREELVKHYTYVLNTSFLEQWNQKIPQLNVAQMPRNLPAWLYIPFFSFSHYPAGLLRMSARSLSVFLRMFMSNGSLILTSRSIAEIRTIVGGGHIPFYNQSSDANST